jgi:hypothetical protein
METGWQRSLWGYGRSGPSECKWLRWCGSNLGDWKVGWVLTESAVSTGGSTSRGDDLEATFLYDDHVRVVVSLQSGPSKTWIKIKRPSGRTGSCFLLFF